MSKKIKAVFFDLGDIFFEAHYWRKWMWDYFCSEVNYKGAFSEFYELYESFLLPVYQGKKKYQAAYDEFLLFIGIKDPEKFKLISFQKKRFFEETRSLFPGVKTTLHKLHEYGLTLTILSDNEEGEGFVRNNILKKFHISEYIHSIYTSAEIGVTKPSPVFFEKAIESLSIKKENVIFVAHDKDEINGAKAFGFNVVEFNNYLKYKTDADIIIDTFSQLIDVIAKYE